MALPGAIVILPILISLAVGVSFFPLFPALVYLYNKLDDKDRSSKRFFPFILISTISLFAIAGAIIALAYNFQDFLLNTGPGSLLLSIIGTLLLGLFFDVLTRPVLHYTTRADYGWKTSFIYSLIVAATIFSADLIYNLSRLASFPTSLAVAGGFAVIIAAIGHFILGREDKKEKLYSLLYIAALLIAALILIDVLALGLFFISVGL